MQMLTADVALKASLQDLNTLTQIRDADGNVIGFFSPASKDVGAMYTQAAAHFDPAELKRRKQSGERGYSTADVLARLNSLHR